MQEINLEINENIEELAEEELLKRRCKRYNSKTGDKKFIDCPKCLNRGYSMRIIDGYETLVRCECMDKRETLERLEASHMMKFKDVRFNQFKADEEWQQIILNIAKEYCVQTDKWWFVAIGQSGSGKTFIASCIANFLIRKQNKNVLYIVWTDFIAKFKRMISGDEYTKEQASADWEVIKNYEILFVDEILKSYNETDIKYFIELINYRYACNLPTIMTSERDLKELVEIDEASASRIVEMTDRCKYLINIKKDIKKNFRFKGAIKNGL